jgi:hypothetical protein
MKSTAQYRRILLLATSFATVLPASAEPVLIGTGQVAVAISAGGMLVSPEQITLLSNVVATTEAPALTVKSVERWDEQRERVRLACTRTTECLPFVVLVTLRQDSPGQPALWRSQPPPTQQPAANPSAKTYDVRAGSAAVLLLEGNHVHIELSVICLENGASGQTIRVATKDRKQTYKARVVDKSIVRASL